MNYVILNGDIFFNDINIKGFKQVDLNGNDRVDGIFGEFTPGILEAIYNKREGRDNVFPEQWLLRDPGVMFMVFKIPENILHDERTELIEKVIELYDEKNFYIEIWSYSFENKWNYFIICTNKQLGYSTFNNENMFVESEKEGLKIIYQKIEKLIGI